MRQIALAIAFICLTPLTSGDGLLYAGQPTHAPDWQAQPLRLLMVTRRGCVYCQQWDAQIGPGYASSAEGQQAPLLKVDLEGPWPDGLVLASRPFLTPTFILLENGQERDRILGYPGDNFFYPLLSDMLRDDAANRKAGG